MKRNLTRFILTLYDTRGKSTGITDGAFASGNIIETGGNYNGKETGCIF